MVRFFKIFFFYLNEMPVNADHIFYNGDKKLMPKDQQPLRLTEVKMCLCSSTCPGMFGVMEAGVRCRSHLGHPPGVGKLAVDGHLLTNFPWADVHLALASLLGCPPLPKACPWSLQVCGDSAHLAPGSSGNAGPLPLSAFRLLFFC